MQLRVNELGLPMVDQFSEEGFVDLVFKIDSLEEDSVHYFFHLAACYNGEVLGMNVRVLKGIKAGFDEEMNLNKDHVYYDGVKFYRSGAESDRLIRTITELYGMNQFPSKMVEAESFTGIALHKGHIDLAKQPVKIKLFGNDGDTDSEDDYYESFFNLDLPNGLVYWNEKDEDYRDRLVKSLSAIAA